MHRHARRRVLELLTRPDRGRHERRAGSGPSLPRTVALGMLGMANWVAWWYRVGTDGDAESVADVLVDLAMTGVRRDDDRQVAPGPWAALALIKGDLTHLESALSLALDPGPARDPAQDSIPDRPIRRPVERDFARSLLTLSVDTSTIVFRAVRSHHAVEVVPFPPERIEQYRRDGLWTGRRSVTRCAAPPARIPTEPHCDRPSIPG